MFEVSSSGRCSHSDNMIIRVPQSTSWPDEHGELSLPDALADGYVSHVERYRVCASSLLGPFKAAPAEFTVKEKSQIAGLM